MKLFIVEAPNKCAKLRSILGQDYSVTASVGHIRNIPEKGLNIDIKNNFEPTFEISKDKKDVVSKIKEMADQAEIIYLATDPDREGEAISWHIYDILSAKNQKKCKRVSYSEITKTAVMKAINEARAINMNWVDAQKARQVLDRLIGYKISPILWHAVQPKTSAGRVQSIALKFVSLKEKEIKAFKPEDFWYIEALMKSKNGEFWTKVVTKDKDNRYLDEKIAKSDLELLKKASFTVGSIESEQRSVKPYPPFDTSSLQSTCSSIFGWGAKKTATIAQDLYSSGKISYIRTDSFNIAEEAIADARTLIGARYASTYLPKTKNN